MYQISCVFHKVSTNRDVYVRILSPVALLCPTMLWTATSNHTRSFAPQNYASRAWQIAPTDRAILVENPTFRHSQVKSWPWFGSGQDLYSISYSFRGQRRRDCDRQFNWKERGADGPVRQTEGPVTRTEPFALHEALSIAPLLLVLITRIRADPLSNSWFKTIWLRKCKCNLTTYMPKQFLSGSRNGSLW